MSDTSLVQRLKNIAKKIEPLYRTYAWMTTARQKLYDFLIRKTRHVIERDNLSQANDIEIISFGTTETVRREGEAFKTEGFGRPLSWEDLFEAGIELPRPFVLQIRNAELFGLLGVVLDSAGNLIVEATEAEWQYFVRTWSSGQILRRRGDPDRRLSGRVISLVSPLGSNYFHWVTGNLARLLGAMEELADDLEDARFLVEQRVPFQAELLKTLLGVPDERILRWEGGRASVESLIIPSYRHTRSVLTNGCQINSARAYRRINQLARNIDIPTPADASPFILIDRRNVTQRKLLNFDRLVDRLRPIGFRVYDLTAMSIPEQLGLFRQARIVIGAHGAGLTNLLFTSGAALIELFPEVGEISDAICYFEIANALSLPHLLVATPCVGPAQDLNLTEAQLNTVEAAVRGLVYPH